MPTKNQSTIQNHSSRPPMAVLNAARLNAGQIREGLAPSRVRKQMVLKFLSAFGLSTNHLLLKNGATKSDLAELAKAGVTQTNRVRFRVDPRANGQVITIVELTARGRRLARNSGAAAEFRPATAKYNCVSHDLLAQSLAIETSRIIGPIRGRIRSIYSAGSILNRPPANREKMFSGVLENYLPDAVLSTKSDRVFLEFERSPKTKQLELYQFTRKIIHLGCAGRVVVGFHSVQRARKFHRELLKIRGDGFMAESFFYNETLKKWFKNQSNQIEIGVNDWPDILGAPRSVDVESGSPEVQFWASFRRAKSGIWIVGNFREVGQKIPFFLRPKRTDCEDAWEVA